MYSNTIINAIIKDFNPESIESWPKDGPIIASCTIWAGAGNLPDFNTLAKSFPSLTEKSPEISDLPPEISSFTVGHDFTYPSKTIAIDLPLPSGPFSAAALPVASLHILAPSAFILIETSTFPLSNTCWASEITLPSRIYPLFPLLFSAITTNLSLVSSPGSNAKTNLTSESKLLMNSSSLMYEFKVEVSFNKV